MMSSFKILVAVLLSSCASEASSVTIRVLDATPAQESAILEGGAFWETVGIYLSQTNRDDADITIRVVSDLGGPLGLAWPDRRYAEIENHDPHSWPMISTAAHEIGHLLISSSHLPNGEQGVMSSPYTGDVLTDADFLWACKNAGLGCDLAPEEALENEPGDTPQDPELHWAL